MQFCKCGSLMIDGSCTNKKCPAHIDRFEPATPGQISEIKELLEKLLRDYKESDFSGLSIDDAQKTIDDLQEELSESEAGSEEYEFDDTDLLADEEDEEEDY